MSTKIIWNGDLGVKSPFCTFHGESINNPEKCGNTMIFSLPLGDKKITIKKHAIEKWIKNDPDRNICEYRTFLLELCRYIIPVIQNLEINNDVKYVFEICRVIVCNLDLYNSGIACGKKNGNTSFRLLMDVEKGDFKIFSINKHISFSSQSVSSDPIYYKTFTSEARISERRNAVVTPEIPLGHLPPPGYGFPLAGYGLHPEFLPFSYGIPDPPIESKPNYREKIRNRSRSPKRNRSRSPKRSRYFRM